MVFSSPNPRNLPVAVFVRDLRRVTPDRVAAILFNVFLAVGLWGGVVCLRQVALSLASHERALPVSEAILGKWQDDDSGLGMEFTRDGRFKLSRRGDVVETGVYSFADAGKMDEIQLQDIRLQPGDRKEDREHRFRVMILGDTLTVSAPSIHFRQFVGERNPRWLQPLPPDGRVARFRRIP